jgi:aryl-alcohol dehydrogenase-like predicted oxidoreductase
MPMTRRDFLRVSGGSMLWVAARTRADGGGAAMLQRPVPRSGELLPAIGLGTWQTFDVGGSAEERAPLAEVLRLFLGGGGRVVDSSPMYGRAEGVTGDLLAGTTPAPGPFLATKVWTTGRSQGEAQMRESARRLRSERIDLMQVHNLLDWETHLPVLRAWKEQGRIRHLGVTHYAPSSFPLLERMLATERLDFVQLPYSIGSRDAEKRLLPAAAESGTAVLVMRPFEEGALFSAVRGKPLPGWAAEIGAATWAQAFLKFVISHPAVTCAIPATRRADHVLDNLASGSGAMPDERMRRRMAADFRH